MVTVYSVSSWVQCTITHHALEKKGINFTVDHDPENDWSVSRPDRLKVLEAANATSA